MSRLDRLKEYANPGHGPQGAARDQKNIDTWSERATENSKIAPRATDSEMKLPSTTVKRRDTAMGAKVSRGADKRMAAKDDLNMVGDSAYMRGIRRNA